MRGGSRKGAGRRPTYIDILELEKLSALHCTHEEIAAWSKCSVRTIEKYAKKPEFAEAMARGRAKGRISVRRWQMRLLESGSVAMAIWLGKQLLGQRDVSPLTKADEESERPNIVLNPEIDDPDNL